ncbi:uncharacterized protein LOC111052574 isoform X1 [Nilaparvata lugens]|uniref:uncharacterized protein LOC111052574 isoform X1 n=1 Tax=Nilaparvata lugens TaxID=108931 RepID=UPI00193D0BA5|nr:uncharacterized protein LOC111052574 isoform X1 [Nilaparvata lugens]
MTQIDENKQGDQYGDAPSSPVTPLQRPLSAVPGEDTATILNSLHNLPQEVQEYIRKIDVPPITNSCDENIAGVTNPNLKNYGDEKMNNFVECGDGDKNNVEPPKTTPTICDRLRNIRKNITVEPMLIFYIIPSVLASLATQNLNLEKACRVNLRLGDKICTSLELRETSNYTLHETKVQQLVAEMQIWKTLLQSSVPVILIMFLGSWSDRHRKRKPCMLLPILGEFLTGVSLILCTYFFYELPMQVTGVLEAILSAMTGGWKTMFMAIYSYIGDISTDQDRTLRIGIVNTVSSVGIPIGTALSGILYNKCGPYTVLSIAAMFNVCSFLYGFIMIHEGKSSINKPPPDLIPQQDKPLIEKEDLRDENGLNQQNLDEMDLKNSGKKRKRCCLSRFIRDFFDFQHIVEIFDVAFRNASSSRRKKTFGLIMIVVFIFGPKRGEMTVMYLFTRYRFNWNEVDYSVFSTYSMVTNLIGTLFSVGVFSHMLKIDDALIGVMSCMSKIMAGFVYAFATTTWMIYLAPIVDIVNGTSFIAMRSIASKLVPPEELGKVNSLFGVCEALMPLVYGPMYSAVYASTMHTMPGAFFLLGGALTTPAVVIFAWMYTEHKKDEVLERIAKEKECRKENGDLKNDSVKIQVVSTPQMQPEVQPQRQPEVQPQIQPQRQPEVQPQRQPEVQPQRQPEVQPPGQPQVQPQRQPELHPQGQPNDAGFVNQGFEADETSRST